MKHALIFLTLSFSLLTFGQSHSKNPTRPSEWLLSIGVNTINNINTNSPPSSLDDWAFKTPFAINGERVLDNHFSIDFGISLNGNNKNDNTNGGSSVDNYYSYFSMDPSVKYYFGDIIFPEDSGFQLYGMAGLGFFFINESSISLNIGGGMLVWLNENHSFGVKLQSLAKFDLNQKNELYETNHFQLHLQVVFAL